MWLPLDQFALCHIPVPLARGLGPQFILFAMQVMSEGDLETDEEEDVQVLGGEGFSAEDIAAAETRFEAQLVSTNTKSRLHHQEMLRQPC